MITDRMLIAGLVAVFLALLALQATGNGMAGCQSTHSFEVCFDALN